MNEISPALLHQRRSTKLRLGLLILVIVAIIGQAAIQTALIHRMEKLEKKISELFK